ncbi:uncharacterized protein DS421_14g471010 [Arachis hypogaea]|nr:uncharacterized protein DS421_14g471010 [Arachis hypogaea]
MPESLRLLSQVESVLPLQECPKGASDSLCFFTGFNKILTITKESTCTRRRQTTLHRTLQCSSKGIAILCAAALNIALTKKLRAPRMILAFLPFFLVKCMCFLLYTSGKNFLGKSFIDVTPPATRT